MGFVNALWNDPVEAEVEIHPLVLNLYSSRKTGSVKVYDKRDNQLLLKIILDSVVYPPSKRIYINLKRLKEIGFEVELE